MEGIGIWLIAFGMGMDCFAISVSNGILLKRESRKTMLAIATSFAVFHTVMPILGWLCAKYFIHLIEEIDHWVAFAILAFLGVRMVINYFKKDSDRCSVNPHKPKFILSMSIATSIDVLAVGISFSLLGVETLFDVLQPALILGFVAFLMSIVGSIIGSKYGMRSPHRSKAELWGGLILIFIGTKILIEHTLLS